MVYQRYCRNCGHSLTFDVSNCPNCGEEVDFNFNYENLLLKIPIYDVGFFNFYIDFSPFIENNNKVTDYSLCSNCNFLIENGVKKCPKCGKSLKSGFFNKIDSLFSRDEKEVVESSGIKCECGYFNSATDNFCLNCGRSLKKEEYIASIDRLNENFNIEYDESIFCHCGKENSIDDFYCNYCGSPLFKLDNVKEMGILCTCGTLNNINNKRCMNCGSNLEHENEVLVCVCGNHNKLTDKYCLDCERALNPNRRIKSKIVCKCGSILNYSDKFCLDCGNDIQKSINRSKKIDNAKTKIGNFWRRIN